MGTDEKQWTIFIYANGNNELEPEMWQAKKEAEQAVLSSKMNVVMQIARADRRLARLMRPENQIPDTDESWSGTRRYYLRKGKSDFLQDLGNINMAHPGSLFDFIKWGIENYPARKYMLVLGGHAFQLVGMMPDYNQEQPYIMGFAELARALELIKEDTGQYIDILVLDTCFANSVEVLYELGHRLHPAVRNVLTFIGGGPIGGLPHRKFVNLVQGDKAEEILKRTVERLNLDLIAIKINHKQLKKIYNLAGELACNLLNDKSRKDQNTLQKFVDTQKTDPWYDLVVSLYLSIARLIISYKRVTPKQSGLITMPAAHLEYPVTDLYCKLAFGQNKYWTNLMLEGNEAPYCPAHSHVKLEPTILPLGAVYSYLELMNPSLRQDQIKVVLQELIEYRNWNLD